MSLLHCLAMGCSLSMNIDVDETAITRHVEIERELVKEKAQIVRKLLLLGAGECGKTTILKQMRNMHAPFSDSELRFYRPLIFSMITTSMHVLVEAVTDQFPEFLESSQCYNFQKHAACIKGWIESGNDNQPLTGGVSESAIYLWQLAHIQEAFSMHDDLHINSSLDYFLTNLPRICSPNYKPSVQDVLNVSAPTVGVQEVRFKHANETTIRVFDVGGQKSQRRKWIHLFDNVDAVIFITAISEFNQSMREDNATNRLGDSLYLFKESACNKYLLKTALILFLNKTDLFRQKLQHNLSIVTAFPDYEGDNSYSDSIAFLSRKFKTEGQESVHKKIVVHETCAVDTGQIQAVLNAVTDIVLNRQVGNWFFS